MLDEAIEGLQIKPNGIYVDGTFGRGGHSRAILSELSESGELLAFDKDPTAVTAGREALGDDSRFRLIPGSFTQLMTVASELNWVGKIDGILLDLGVSSPQLDEAERGFSFLRDGPLDMRMDPTQSRDAFSWLDRAPVDEIALVLREYGEERYAKRIARAIVNARQETPITRTKQLADIVTEANPNWERHKHPATRAFQAIRIFINQELEELRAVLEQCLDVLTLGGFLVVISFHSLEDRIVKRFMQRHANGVQLPVSVPVTKDEMHMRLRRVGRAFKAGEEEVRTNPRSRSAIMRIGEKIG